MRYFMFRLRWSQTDSDYILVKASSEANARLALKANARYIELVGSTGKIIEGE